MTGKWIWIIAGPPGAGKTSLCARLFPEWIGTSRHIDADDITGFDPDDDLPPTLHKRIVPVTKRLQIANVGERDFAIETRFLNREPLIAAQKLGRRDWRVALIYLALPRIDLCRQRVRARVALGGPDVPADTMARTFRTALDELGKYLDIADRWLILDSSGRRRPRIAHGDRTSATAFQADALRALAPGYPFHPAPPAKRSAPWADMVTNEFDKMARRHDMLDRLRSLAFGLEQRQTETNHQ